MPRVRLAMGLIVWNDTFATKMKNEGKDKQNFFKLKQEYPKINWKNGTKNDKKKMIILKIIIKNITYNDSKNYNIQKQLHPTKITFNKFKVPKNITSKNNNIRKY